MTARVRRQLPLALAALAGVFVVKLSVLLTLGHHPLLVPAGELDGAYYFHFARQAAGGDWMLDDAASFFGRPAPAFFVPPLYIYVLALLLKIGGGSLEAARFGQIVLGTAAVGLLALTARRWYGVQSFAWSFTSCACSSSESGRCRSLMKIAAPDRATRLASRKNVIGSGT